MSNTTDKELNRDENYYICKSGELNSPYSLHDRLLHLSQCSSRSMSSESDLSTLSFDKELDLYTHAMHSDELPAFEIRLISPMGRTPSPIDSDFDTPTKCNKQSLKAVTIDTNKTKLKCCDNNSEFITLQDVNAQINPPSDTEEQISRTNSLETIFEGVFLNTPPKKSGQRTCSKLIEKVIINRLQFSNESFAQSCQKPKIEGIVQHESVKPEYSS